MNKSITVQEVVLILRKKRFSELTNEKRLQNEIEFELKKNGVEYNREKKMSDGNIIDFYLPSIKCGIEVKIKRGALKLYEQVERYSKTGLLSSIIIVSNIPMAFPEVLSMKTDVFVVNISKSLL